MVANDFGENTLVKMEAWEKEREGKRGRGDGNEIWRNGVYRASNFEQQNFLKYFHNKPVAKCWTWKYMYEIIT